MTDAFIDRICTLVSPDSYTKSHTFYTQGSPSDFIYILLSGEITFTQQTPGPHGKIFL